MANKFFNVHNGLVVGPATIDATSGNIVTTSTTNSNSTQSGALRVVGGAGIGGNLNIGGSFTLTGTASINSLNSATSTQSGALVVGGGVGVGGNLYVGGEIVAQKLTIQLTTVTTTMIETDDIIKTINTTQSTSTTTGALQVSGGAGIGGNLYVGGTIFGTINATVNTATNANNISVAARTTDAAHFLTFVDANNSSAEYESVYTTSSFTINPSTGNIGIGTTNSTEKLTINNGHISLSSGYHVRSPDNFNIYDTSVNLARFGFSTNNLYATRSTGQHSFLISGTTIVTFANNGNVGIGTATPSVNLDVSSTTNAIIRAFGSSIGRLSLQNSTRHYSLSVQGANLLFFDETGGTTRATLTSAGNFGIGTSSPSHKLDVAGAISMHDEAQDLDSRYYAGTYLRGWKWRWGSESNITYTTTSTSPVGTEVLSVSSAVWARGPRIRLDRTQNYEVEMWVRKTAGASSGTYYMVVSNWDSNGNAIGGDGTDWHYPVNSVQTNLTTGTWVRHSFIVGPYGGTKNHNSSATQISVGFIANLGGGTDTLELTGFKCRPISNYNNNPITFNNNGNISIGSTATAATKMDVTGGVRISGITTVTNTTAATSTNNGALQVAGGVGIGGDLRVGGVIYGTINATANTATNANNIATVQRTTNAAHYLTFVPDNNSSSGYEPLYTTASVIVNPGSGYMGLGTTAPDRRLHLSSADYSGSALRFTRSTSNYDIGMGSDGRLAFTSDSAERMSISQSGNVGIGTASPGAYKLAVVGDQFTNVIFESTQTGSYIQLKSSGGSAFFSTPTANSIGFHTSATATERMRIDPMGNVGINISSPTKRLDVRGDAIFTATSVPTSDIVTISNQGYAVTTSGTNALQVTYVGGTGAIEASAVRSDMTPGGTSGSIWSAFRVAATAAAGSGVTFNGIKFDTKSAGAGTSNALWVGTGYDNIINYNGTTVINGTGQVIAAQVLGAVTSATSAGSATNLAGGATGSIPYQNAAGTTLFIPIGGNGTLLQSNGTTATWVSTGSLVTSIAASATSVATTAEATNASYYPTFVDTNNATSAYELLYTTSSFVINPQSGNVGIGTISPATLLNVQTTGATSAEIRASGVNGIVSAHRSASNASGPNFILNKSRGNVNTRLAVNSGDSLGQISFQGFGGSSDRTLGFIQGVVDTYTTDTNISSYLTFGTSSSFGGVERMRIDSSGRIGIGTVTPSSLLHVAGTTLLTGVTTVTNTTAASSTVTGALIVNGGIGVGNNVYIAGSLFATTKSFLIDHPTKPGKKLRYGSLEGPENGIYVRGRVRGTEIELPEYWTKLVDPESITVNLTPIGRNRMPRINRIENNRIYLNKPWFGQIDCYYIVFAERNDIEKLEPEI